MFEVVDPEGASVGTFATNSKGQIVIPLTPVSYTHLMLTAEYFSDRIGTASVEVEGTMRELNTMHITNYTPRFRKTNSLGRRQLLTPDEVLRLPPDQVLIFIQIGRAHV